RRGGGAGAGGAGRPRGERGERGGGDPAGGTGALEGGLGPGGRAVLAVAVNRRDADVAPLLAGLPASAREALDRLSPLAAVPGLPGRLLIAHGAADDSIPFTESLWLAGAGGGRARRGVPRGVPPPGPRSWWGSLGDHAHDGWALLALADDLLAP